MKTKRKLNTPKHLDSSPIYFGEVLDFVGHCRVQLFLLGLRTAPSPCTANCRMAKTWFLSSSARNNGGVHKPGLRLSMAGFLVRIHRLQKPMSALWEE